jgi:hypothetical protein
MVARYKLKREAHLTADDLRRDRQLPAATIEER